MLVKNDVEKLRGFNEALDQMKYRTESLTELANISIP